MVSIWLTKVKGGWRNSNIKKIGFAGRSRFSSNTVGFEEGLLAILLDARRAQSGKAMLVDGKLPREELVDRQRVAAAGLLKGEQTAANCGNDFRLTANNPPFCTGRGQIRNC
jgi:hypothetical protein